MHTQVAIVCKRPIRTAGCETLDKPHLRGVWRLRKRGVWWRHSKIASNGLQSVQPNLLDLQQQHDALFKCMYCLSIQNGLVKRRQSTVVWLQERSKAYTFNCIHTNVLYCACPRISQGVVADLRLANFRYPACFLWFQVISAGQVTVSPFTAKHIRIALPASIDPAK